MAIAVRNFAVANTGAAQGTGDVGITVSVPAGTLDGDVMYMALMAASSTGVFVNPGGVWTEVEPQFASTGQASAKMIAYRKVAASEPASYTVTWGAAASTGRVAAIMCSFSGMDTVTPEQDENNDPGAGPTSTEILPSVTASSATVILGIAGAYTPSFGATTWTEDAAMTEVTETTSAHLSASNASIQFAIQSVSAGATGTRTATGSRADLRPCGVMIALDPAPIVAAGGNLAPVIYGRGAC